MHQDITCLAAPNNGAGLSSMERKFFSIKNNFEGKMRLAYLCIHAVLYYFLCLSFVKIGLDSLTFGVGKVP